MTKKSLRLLSVKVTWMVMMQFKINWVKLSYGKKRYDDKK